MFVFFTFSELEANKGIIEILDEIKKILDVSNPTLSEKLHHWDVKKVTLLMKAAALLSNDDFQLIHHEKTTSGKVDKMLEILHRKPKEAYYGFIGALYRCKRRDMHDILRENQRKILTGMNMQPMEMLYSKMIAGHMT